MKNSDGLYMFEGHYGEYIIIYGRYSNGGTFNIYQIIREGELIPTGDNRYLETRASTDGKYIVITTAIEAIEYCGATVEQVDDYITKSFADETYIRRDY